MPHDAGTHLAAQVDRAHGEVVDADLRPDPRRAAPAQGQRRTRPPHPSRALGTQLVEES
ncbi:hypothetical protein QFZ75_006812 [Streptomyces sp. V3I8]|nr:hypothetical protein [Streptomyces sp. V3I8]